MKSYQDQIKDYRSYKKMIASNGPATAMEKDAKNCAVLALSAAFEIPYDYADAFARVQWKRKSRRGTNTNAIINTMKSATSNSPVFEKVAKECNVINVYVTPKKLVNCRSKLYTFANNNKKGTYYVLTRGHALVVKDGQILDGTKPGSAVRYAWKIEDAK